MAEPLLDDYTSFGFPMNFQAAAGLLYICASHSELGIELWRSDGTREGTGFVKDISPGEASSFPSHFQEMNDVAYFQADDGAHGNELWRTDGTEEGTWLVADINPGPSNSAPYQFTTAGDTLFFAATTEMEGTELWRSDGTRKGTLLVKDIFPGPESSNLYAPEILNNALYFSANHPEYSEELWRSDGTPEGTKLVRDIAPGAAKSEPYNLTSFNNAIYFSANDGLHGEELWRTDGTTKGTRLLSDLNSANHVVVSSNPARLSPCGEYVFFVADDLSHGAELWCSDVLSGETTLVKDIAPGSAHADPQELAPVLNLLYFTAVSSASTRQLWRTDGTGEGTRKVILTAENDTECIPRQLLSAADVLYIVAKPSGGEDTLFRLDGEGGTPESLGTAASLFGGAGTLRLTLVDNRVFVVQDNAAEYCFAVLERAAAMPRLLAVRVPLSANWPDFQTWHKNQGGGVAREDRDVLCAYLALPGMNTRYALGEDVIYFSAFEPETGTEIWKAAQGVSDAKLLKDCFEGGGSGGPAWLTMLGDQLLFSAEHAGKGREVWTSDGATENTYVLDEPHSRGPLGGAPRELMAWKGEVWFTQVGNERHTGRRTLVACSINSDRLTIYGNSDEFNYTAFNPRELTVVGEHLYFSADSPETGRELWRFQREPAKLEMVANIAPETGYTVNTTVPIP